MGFSRALNGNNESGLDYGDSLDDTYSSSRSGLDSRSATVSWTGVDEEQSFDAPFSMLPVEIIILIFQHAARSSKAMAASLSLVSRLARSVVLPQLFRTLVLQERNNAHKHSVFLNRNPRIANYVRELWMRRSTASDASLVLTCKRLERLAITPSCFNALFEPYETAASNCLMDTSESPLPYELLFLPGLIKWNDIVFATLGVGVGARESLQCLTHLWLSQESQLVALLECREVIARLQQLTHLASPVEEVIVRLPLQEVLNAFPRLQMFVMTPSQRYDPWINYQRFATGAVNRSLSLIMPIVFGRDTKDADDRLYYVESCGRTQEELFFDFWNGPGSDIWTSARPVSRFLFP